MPTYYSNPAKLIWNRKSNDKHCLVESHYPYKIVTTVYLDYVRKVYKIEFHGDSIPCEEQFQFLKPALDYAFKVSVVKRQFLNSVGANQP